jgi:hypothetical protein
LQLGNGVTVCNKYNIVCNSNFFHLILIKNMAGVSIPFSGHNDSSAKISNHNPVFKSLYSLDQTCLSLRYLLLIMNQDLKTGLDPCNEAVKFHLKSFENNLMDLEAQFNILVLSENLKPKISPEIRIEHTNNNEMTEDSQALEINNNMVHHCNDNDFFSLHHVGAIFECTGMESEYGKTSVVNTKAHLNCVTNNEFRSCHVVKELQQ